MSAATDLPCFDCGGQGCHRCSTAELPSQPLPPMPPPPDEPPGHTPGSARPSQQVRAVEPSQPTAGSTWTPVEPTPYLDGTYQPPQPTELLRTDGLGLLYPGRINLLFGESEVGKGWVALHAVAQALDRGAGVLYLDFEDYPDTIYARLLALGATTVQLAERFRYIRPDAALDQAGQDALTATLADLEPDLVIIDGVTGAMSMHALDTNSATDVDAFYSLLGEPLATTGAAVVLIDHVPKATEGRGKGPIGSQHKRARVSGGSYEVAVVRRFAPGRAGHLRISIDKDRLGAVRQRHPSRAGEFHLDASGDQLRAELRAPETPTEGAGPWKPTRLMERVSLALENTVDGLNARGVLEVIDGRDEHIRTALNQLVEDGYVTREREGKAIVHRSRHAYREAAQEQPREPFETPA